MLTESVSEVLEAHKKLLAHSDILIVRDTKVVWPPKNGGVSSMDAYTVRVAPKEVIKDIVLFNDFVRRLRDDIGIVTNIYGTNVREAGFGHYVEGDIGREPLVWKRVLYLPQFYVTDTQSESMANLPDDASLKLVLFNRRLDVVIYPDELLARFCTRYWGELSPKKSDIWGVFDMVSDEQPPEDFKGLPHSLSHNLYDHWVGGGDLLALYFPTIQNQSE